jgi:antitoxin MazE
MYIQGEAMNLQIARWGDSLVLRIPSDYVRRIGIKEGDHVQVNITVNGGISIRATKWDRQAFVQDLEQTRKAMPMTEPVIEELRRGARN